MLPADVIAEIIANLAALNLQPSTAATVLGALAPLLRTAETPPPAALEPPPRSSRRPRASKRPRGAPRRRKYNRRAPTEARDRALAALKANPNASTTDLAKLAKVSRSTVAKTRAEIAKAERKAARSETTPSTPISKPAERRQRAQQFLREQLARGPKQASVVEEAAAKAHIDEQALGQARADLGVVTSRSNAGGVQAVQWSLPAP
jgi:primosomal protein N'